MEKHYLVQRYHPNLRIGLVPSVVHGKRLMPIHCQQGTWDSACGAHCAAIAMALLGEIHDVAVLSERRNGVAARLWKAAQATYFDGVDVTQLAEMIRKTGVERRIITCTSSHARCLNFILTQLARGRIVIASWRSRRGHQHHFVVVHGIEGMQNGHRFTPTALLALDPWVGEPFLCGYNSRLEFTNHQPPRSASYILYKCSNGSKLAVTLTSTLSIGDTAPTSSAIQCSS